MLVENIEHLKTLAKGKTRKFHIRLIGWIKSVKRIKYHAKADSFFVLSEIDNSTQLLRPSQMMDREFTNIGEAIRKKAFYLN